jgi:8-oxo-dGTP pyrophosphatase MutT (NUDIX family)
MPAHAFFSTDQTPTPDQIAARLTRALLRPPGETAQYRMAPALRKQETAAFGDPTKARPSAVLIVLYPQAGAWHTVLIKRGSYDGAHSDQVSFPGGRRENSDRDLSHTALRETEEEVGLAQHAVRVVGRLTQLWVPASNHLIHPFVGLAAETPVFVPDPAEVSAVLPTALSDLFHPKAKAETTFRVRGGFTIQAPYYDIHQERVWGATAMIISELEAVFAGF